MSSWNQVSHLSYTGIRQWSFIAGLCCMSNQKVLKDTRAPKTRVGIERSDSRPGSLMLREEKFCSLLGNSCSVVLRSCGLSCRHLLNVSGGFFRGGCVVLYHPDAILFPVLLLIIHRHSQWPSPFTQTALSSRYMYLGQETRLEGSTRVDRYNLACCILPDCTNTLTHSLFDT